MRQKDDILRSIPGIGEIAAAAILIECPEIGTLGKKQAASLAGLAPMTRQSGKWQGKAFIQGGRKFLRDALYMSALVAARFNPDLARKYNVFTDAGKPPQVALASCTCSLPLTGHRSSLSWSCMSGQPDALPVISCAI